LHKKKEFPIVVKPPKGLLENPYFSCPVCGKLFKKETALRDHFNERKKDDLEHFLFSSNKLVFKDEKDKRKKKPLESKAFQYEPKFGRINIKTSKED
jgi:hypothetical protein